MTPTPWESEKVVHVPRTGKRADVSSPSTHPSVLHPVSVDDDMLYYEIITHFWHLHLAKISKLDVDKSEMVLVAEIERVPGSNLLSECVLAVRRFGYRMDQ